jgi:glycosyltransferase involved in cell wall biosynthesis
MLAKDIKVAILPPKDQILNVSLICLMQFILSLFSYLYPPCSFFLQVLVRISSVGLQLSIREGFEIKVTEMIMKGLPVIIYRTGGLVLQVVDGETGFIIEPGRSDLVGQKLYELMTNESLLARMKVSRPLLIPFFFSTESLFSCCVLL